MWLILYLHIASPRDKFDTMFLDEPSHQTLQAFAISLGIGLLMGLERERQPDAKAGLRTFALVAVLGCLAALLTQVTGSQWLLAAGLLGIAAMMIVANATDPLDNGDPGTTSVVALLVCYALGAITWYGHASLAVMLGVTTTVLLYFKRQLQAITRSLTHTDILSVLQFSVLSLVILPILPNRAFGPYDALNPQHIWWMVVLISGVSLAGYMALRLVGTRHGAALLGFFGGLVSSTATTMIFSRHARNNAALAQTAMLIILLANMVILLRIGVISFLIAPAIIVPLLLLLGGGLAMGLLAVLWSWRRLNNGNELPMPEIGNPTEIRAAITFAGLYALILVLAAWLQDIAGSQGLYLLAAISGLTDVDAITLSALRLFNASSIDTTQAAITIAVAVFSNLLFKTGIVIAVGGGALAKRTVPGLAAIGLGLLIGLLQFA